MNDERELKTTIQQAVDAIQPEPFAMERVRRRIEQRASEAHRNRPFARWAKRLVPIGLFAVMATASASILVRNLQTGEAKISKPADMTEIGRIDLAIQEITIDPNECVTAGGLVWSRVSEAGEPPETTVEPVTNATDASLVGCHAYRTADGTGLAVTTSTGETRWYRYFGRADAAGNVVDDTFASFLQGSGILDAASVASITVRNPSRDVQTEQNGLVSYMYDHSVISDRDTIQAIMNLLTGLERDMAGYAAACEGSAPYEGHWTMTLQTATGKLRLVFYPKISYVWGGYRVQPDAWERLQTLLASQPTP